MFQRILVPVDLSQKSVAALDTAYELATLSGADVTLLHVIETIEHVAFDEMKDFYRRLEKSAQDGLQEFAERFASAGLKVQPVIIYGYRSKQIVEFAVNNRTDLIVMGSHRVDPDRPGHDWSTISYAVGILAPCPVLLVK